MNVALLVEPEELDRDVLAEALSQAGYEVHTVGTGNHALAACEQVRPDLVLCSLELPDVDGVALAVALQERHAPAWLPVVLVSRSDDDHDRIRSFEAGADAYLVKPVSVKVISARVRALTRILERQRRDQARAAELAQYYAAEEEDKRIAMHLMEKLVNREKLRDAALSYWIQPAASFSGDVIAAARTPSNILHVLLADGTGHGLSASLSVLPITAPFYRMTERGFGIDSIVRELNAKVRDLLPRDRFIATTVAAINFDERSVHVWNGGNPPPLLLVGGGTTALPLASRHLPLGVLEQDEFDASLETRRLPDAGQLLLYSDGLIEAEGRDGQGFGRARLQTALVGLHVEEKLERLRRAVQQHVGGRGAHDDISVVLVDCALDETVIRPVPRPHAASPGAGIDAGSWKVRLALGASELRRVDVVPMLVGLISQLNIAQEHSAVLFSILSELFNNALDHGVLGLQSSLKDEPDGLGKYYEERARRLDGLHAGAVDIELGRGVCGATPVLEIRVTDSGDGFDYDMALAKAIDAVEHGDNALHGRGLLLLRRLCSSVDYLRDGREVFVRYPLQAVDGACRPPEAALPAAREASDIPA